jgi:hypothetical protein
VAQHFNGIASRISAGGRSAPPSAAVQKASGILSDAGVSPTGVAQFLAGQVVSNPADRRTVAAIAAVLLDLKAGEKVSRISLITPAVQSGLRVATKPPAATDAEPTALVSKAAQTLGVSPLSARQLLTAMPVVDRRDGNVFAVWLTTGFYELVEDAKPLTS